MDYYNPYKEAEASLYSNPYKVEMPKAYNNALIADAQIAATTAPYTGADPDKVFARANAGMDSDTFRQTGAAIDAMIQEERQLLTDKLLATPEKAEELKAEAQENVDTKFNSLSDDLIGKYYDVVIQDPEIAEQSELLKRNAAASLYMQHQVADIADKAGIKDLAGSMLIPDLSWKTAEFLSEFDSKNKFDAYINSAEYIYDFATSYNALQPEQKIEVINAIVEALPEITGNAHKQVEILLAATGNKSLSELRLEGWLDKFDAVTLVGGAALGAGKAVVKASRTFNALNTLTKAGNKDLAGYVADALLTDPTNATKFGISADEAVLMADPRQTDELMNITGLNAAPAGVSLQVRNKLNAIDDVLEESTNILDQGLGLSDADKLRAKEAEVKYLQDQMNVDNVVAKNFTEQGFTLQYDTLDEAGEVITKEVQRPFYIDDVGTFVEKEAPLAATTPILKAIVGTGVKAGKGDKNFLLYNYEQIEFASKKLAAGFTQAVNLATKGLNKKSVDRVGYFLEKGDNAGVVFTYQELVNEGVGGVRFN